MQRWFSVDNFPLISIQGVCKSFEQGGEILHVLREIDFEAHSGEIVMIVGPSGSGKTTLLSAMAGTLKVDQGKIRIFDFDLHTKTSSEIIEFRRQKIGFIFQQFHLIPTLSIGENVAIPLILNGKPHDISLEKARRYLKQVGLEGKFDAFPRELSGGQQQRVAIVRALIHEPQLIICDEPTSALDADSGIKIMDLIHSHVKMPGRVVVVVTHDNRIFKYADRIVKMEDGRISTFKGMHD